MTADDPSEGRGPTPVPGGPIGAADPVDRRFSDEEVAELIRKALQLQESSRDRGAGPSAGLTLAEVRQVAAEVGIDPRFVEQAVSSVPVERDREGSRLVGGPWAWRYRRTVPGEVPEEERARILQAIRDVMGAKGEVQDVYGRMEWSHDDGLGPVIVGVTSRDGATEVDVSARRGGEAGMWHGLAAPIGGIVGGAILAKTIGLTDVAALGSVLGSAGVAYLGSRALWGHLSARWASRLRRLTDRVSEAAGRVALPASGGEDEG